MIGAIIGGVILLIIAAFCIWCVLRIAGNESRIEEQYRIKKALEKATKKKGKK